MKSIIPFLVLTTLCHFKSFCQTDAISGVIEDSVTNIPLVAATASLTDMDGKILRTTATDKQGRFSILHPNQKSLFLLITYVQYSDKKIEIKNKSGSLDLGVILLSAKAASLSEIVVQGKKAPVAFKVDRQVFKASQFSNAAGGTGTDLIRNLPSVSVNGQGEISFRGSTSFLVLINGKPTQGDPSFVLGQLPAGSVENIEVITSPSAAYDADGKAGIINIITKTGTQDGWMVQTNIMGGLPPLKDYDNRKSPQRFGADFSAGYRKNKWDISGGLNYLRNDIAGRREGDVFTIIGNTKTSFPSVGERSFKRYNYGGRFAATYQADNRNAVTAGFYRGKKYQNREADLNYHITRENLTNGTKNYFSYYNANNQQKEGQFTLANIDWSHQFINKAKIVFSTLYERAALSGVTTNNNLISKGSKDTLQYTKNPFSNPLDALRFKVDYSKKIHGGNFQAGYQYRYDVQDGNFLYQTKILGTNTFNTDPQYSSEVKATNHIHAAYMQYAAAIKKLNYSAGIRLEQSDRALNFSKNNEQTNLSLTNFFPSVQLRYAAWNKGILKAGYSRRIKRTNNYELNPFPEREHSETLEQGDPKLLPELIGTYEAGIEQVFPKGNFFSNIYYQRTTNPIQRVNKVFNDTILNRVFTNAGHASQLGLESNFSYQVTKFWSSTIGGNIYKYKIDGNIFNGAIAVNNDSWVYSINSTQSFTLPKNWMMQLSINYLSLHATAQGEDSRFLTPHFTIKKTTSDKRWSFQAQWLNIDAGINESNRQRITTSGSNFYTTTNYIYETDQVQLSVSFNLNKRNRKINLPQSEMGEKEF